MPRSSRDPPDGRTRDIGVQVNIAPPKSRAWLYWAVGIGALAFLGPIALDMAMHWLYWLQESNGWQVSEVLIEDMGMEGVITFKQHDRDNDGMLSLEEFEPIAHRLRDVGGNVSYEEPIEEWDEVLSVYTGFQPIRTETMTKDVHDQWAGNLDSLAGLKAWTKVVKPWQNFGASHFRGFMPREPHLLDEVGEVYWLIEPPDVLKNGPALSSNRYIPHSLTNDAEVIVHRLLQMFHARPFVYTRFAPQGSVACVRAYNDRYVEIVFRIHAEFQLNEPPFYPFWFSPAQFTGRLIINKDHTRVLLFHMYVPTEKRLNVDMEWQNGPKDEEQMEVDIGFMPQMEARATRGSVHVMYGGHDNRERYIDSTEDYEESIQNIVWKEEISMTKARRNLEVKLYPFKQVFYHNFTDAFPIALKQNRLVHNILLWGALDDQSC